MSEQHLRAIVVGIVVIGVLAQWIAWRSRLRAIGLRAASGIFIGTVSGWADPGEVFGSRLRSAISLGVATILFEVCLRLDLGELRGAAQGVSRLVYLGAPLAWFAASLAAHFLAGLDWSVTLVFSAIMVVTGPRVIFESLWRLHVRGCKFSRTTFTESYSYSDFPGTRPTDAFAVMILGSDGRLRFSAADAEFESVPGNTLSYDSAERDAKRPAPIRKPPPAQAS